MPPVSYSFLDVVVLDEVRERFATGDALAVLSTDLDQIIWANGPGAALFGYADIETAIGASPNLGFATKRQISATSGFPAIGRDRSILLRMAIGMSSRAVSFLASAVKLPDAEMAILLAVPAVTGDRGSAGNIAERAISGFNEPGHFVAFVDGDGTVEAASPGFDALGLSADTLADLAMRLSGTDRRIAKRLLAGARGALPAGMARLTDTRHLLVVIDESEIGEEPAGHPAEEDNAVFQAEVAVHPSVEDIADATARDAISGEEDAKAEVSPAIDVVPDAPETKETAVPADVAEQTGGEGSPAIGDHTAVEPALEVENSVAGSGPIERDDWYFSAADTSEPAATDPDKEVSPEAPAEPEPVSDSSGGVESVGTLPVAAAEEPAVEQQDDTPAVSSSAEPPAVDTSGGETATGDVEAAAIEPETAPPAAIAPKIDRASVPVRFVWRTDAEGKFSQISPEFSHAVGAEAADVVGRSFDDVARAFGLDPSGEIAGLLARRDTWSGRSVLWPVAGTDLQIPVDLAALPVYSRDRTFEGFRGFGVARAGDAVVDPEGVGLVLMPAAGGAEASSDAPRAETASDVKKPADPFQGEVPALTIVPQPDRRFTDKVIRLAEHRQPANDKGLSSGERMAFQQIGERLKKDSDATAAPAGVEDASAIATEPNVPDTQTNAEAAVDQAQTVDRVEAVEATETDIDREAVDTDDVPDLLILDGATGEDLESVVEPAQADGISVDDTAGPSGETKTDEASANLSVSDTETALSDTSLEAAEIETTSEPSVTEDGSDGAPVREDDLSGDETATKDPSAIAEPRFDDAVSTDTDKAEPAKAARDEAAPPGEAKAVEIGGDEPVTAAAGENAAAETAYGPQPAAQIAGVDQPPEAAAEAEVVSSPEASPTERPTPPPVRKASRPGMSLLDFAQWDHDDPTAGEVVPPAPIATDVLGDEPDHPAAEEIPVEPVNAFGGDALQVVEQHTMDEPGAPDSPAMEAEKPALKLPASEPGVAYGIAGDTSAPQAAAAGFEGIWADAPDVSVFEPAKALGAAPEPGQGQPVVAEAASTASANLAGEADQSPLPEAAEAATTPLVSAEADEAEHAHAPAESVDHLASGDGAAGRADFAILEKLPVPVLVHSGDALHYANAEFLALTGYDSVEALSEAGGIGTLFADPYEDEDTSGRSDRQLRLKNRDGAEFPVEAFLQSVPWNGGKALLLVLSRAKEGAFGSTGQSPLIAELETLVAEMRTIIDTATDGVVLIARDGSIRSISRPAEALFGFDSDDVAGKPFASLFAIESQRAARDYLNGLSDNGVASVLNDGREVIGRESEGRFIPLFMTIGKLPNDSGYCAVVRDITQWKRAEEDLTQARALAERASSHKTEFLARVSHEIRTPLNAIIGFSELMVDERFGPVANDRYRDYLRDINRSGNHVLDLVNDLLDISKIEAGQQEMAYEAVSLNDTLAETVAMMQPQANRERVIIRSSFASKLPDVVADLRSVRQIALNILSNAVRYTQAGGQVIVSTAYEVTGDVMMRVRDTGIGMTQAEIEQALKPFKQINSLKRARGDGTGLGLPLTKAMVEANRAKFTINSTPGEGTLVEIAFPSTRVLAD